MALHCIHKKYCIEPNCNAKVENHAIELYFEKLDQIRQIKCVNKLSNFIDTNNLIDMFFLKTMHLDS